jgi:hypothetical protein
MLKTFACFGLAAAIAASPAIARAQTGTSSSWGSYGYYSDAIADAARPLLQLYP